MLGLQHGNDLLQVVKVNILWKPTRTEYGDDALGDVGQVDLTSFFHDGWPSHWPLVRKYKVQEFEEVTLISRVNPASLWTFAESAKHPRDWRALVHSTEVKCSQPQKTSIRSLWLWNKDQQRLSHKNLWPEERCWWCSQKWTLFVDT